MMQTINTYQSEPLNSEHFHTIAQVQRANRSIGHYWFTPESMRFLRCRLGRTAYARTGGGCYFISSERRPRSNDPRRYTVRVALPTGEVDTVGEFQGFATRRQALAGIRRLQRGRYGNGLAVLLTIIGGRGVLS